MAVPVAQALRQAYPDVGAVIRGLIQIVGLIVAGVIMWTKLAYMVESNRGRLIDAEATIRAHGVLLAQLPTMQLTASNLQKSVDSLSVAVGGMTEVREATLRDISAIREAMATVSTHIENLRAQQSRLEDAINRRSNLTGPERGGYPGRGGP